MAGRNDIGRSRMSNTVEAGYQSGSATDSLVAKPSKKLVEFRILHPDQSVYSFELPQNCTGQECLDQVNLKGKKKYQDCTMICTMM